MLSLSDQLYRAVGSIGANIAEGYGFGPSNRMRNHLRIAYASAIETEDLLELLAEEGITEKGLAAQLQTSCDRSQKLLTGLLRRFGWLDYSQPRGTKGEE